MQSDIFSQTFYHSLTNYSKRNGVTPSNIDKSIEQHRILLQEQKSAKARGVYEKNPSIMYNQHELDGLRERLEALDSMKKAFEKMSDQERLVHEILSGIPVMLFGTCDLDDLKPIGQIGGISDYTVSEMYVDIVATDLRSRPMVKAMIEEAEQYYPVISIEHSSIQELFLKYVALRQTQPTILREL